MIDVEIGICSRTSRWIGIISRVHLQLILFLISAHCAFAQSNPIVVENSLPGNPSSQWDLGGPTDPSIQGFATEMSVNRGERVRFKVDTDASNYRIDIYRLGYYQGLGARLITSVTPSVSLPQTQPDPISDSATGLVDCGNWSESAHWDVPVNATSGVYIGKLVRPDTGGASHIIFIVRDDVGSSDLLFQTSDTTWQAYNSYGGNSLYVGSPAGRAYKVSYNRPDISRDGPFFTSLFVAEYPMIRWLERNGYNVSYTTGVETDRHGERLTNHKVFLSVGHDEYWSGQQRSNVEAARNAAVHLAFSSGNEVFWKTRWEPSIDGAATPYRTLVCYKETHANAKIDPTSTWTGTWRDPRFTQPPNGGSPENALTGTIFGVNGPSAESITVPAAYGKHRFWRNTSVATLTSGQAAVFAPGTLGFEWDQSPDDGFQPQALMRLSSATVSVPSLLLDYGSTYGPGQATHSLSLYRHSSGALVFGAGTVQWSWGLDSVHDDGSAAADPRLQQAMVNLLADMGSQPATLQADLTSATASNDFTAPSSTILTPESGAMLQVGAQVLITGNAGVLPGGVPPPNPAWGVEVSTDGNTWQPAVGPAAGQTSWSFAWTPAVPGSVTIKSRAFDDSGNLETPGPGVTVSVAGSQQLTIWPSSAVPSIVDQGADHPVALGVKFYSEVGGTIKGIRFYKSSANTGTHVGNLWSSTGTLLATTTFASETASGWQQANFTTPVPINSFTIYVASYHANTGHYSFNPNYFSTNRDNSPLHAPLSGGSWGGNGVYAYGGSSTFPDQTFNANNYWVDVVLQAGPAPTLSSIAVTPTNPTVIAGATQQFTATGTYSNGSTQNITSQATWTSSSTAVATINASGLATGVSAGSATITAALSGVTGSASLTVQSPPTLSSISVTPANPTINTGATQQFTATGTYSNGSTQNITSQVTWTSSSTAVATINASGLATGASAGSTMITAGLSGVTGSTTLTVQAASLAITTTSLPNGTLNVAYSATLAASGGTLPYTWSISVGSLPPGLTLNSSSGAIGGTPTATGSYGFTVQVSDAGNAQTATRALSITVAAAPSSVTIWPSTAVPVRADGGADSAVELGVKFRSDVAGTITGIRFYKASANTGTHVGNLWSSTGTLLASATFTGETGSGWQQVNFATPVVTISANTVYVASYHANNGHYSIDTNYFSTTGVDNPPLHALASGGSGGNGVYRYGASSAFPNQTFNAANYWVDVVFQAAAPATLNSIAVTPTNPTIIAGGTQQFTATGTYSDGSTQNITSQATWTSSSTAVATINPSGLATGASAGSTTITAALSGVTGSASLTVQSPPTLSSIAVTPTNPTIIVGATQQFTATGTYSDGSTQNITSQVTWASSNTAVATVSAGGLAIGQSGGSSTVSAALSGLTGSTTLTVVSLAITTNSLPNGTPNVAYSATLAASGGTLPYTWSILNGAPPPGLSLNSSSGAIAGTPTATGSYSFTVQVSDAGNAQTATKGLGITVAAAPSSVTIWPSAAVPLRADGGADSAVELGVKFRSDVAGTITGIRFYKASANTGTHVGNLWSSTGTLLATATFTGETGSGWQQVNFGTPVTISANTVYVASYHANNGHYSIDTNFFTTGVDNPPLHALASATSGGNGVYRYGASSAFPNQTFNAANYWVDVVFQATESSGQSAAALGQATATPVSTPASSTKIGEPPP